MKKLFVYLDAKRVLIIKRGQNENDNAITKNKLTKRNTKKSLIVEYTHETKKEFKINMLQKNWIERYLKF